MNEKVVLKKAQADALELAVAIVIYPSLVIESHASDRNGWLDNLSALNGIDLDTLIRALYIGYEVEKTPEEELVEAYLNKKEHGGARCGYFAEGIRFAVDKLGQKIKGINE